MILASYDGDLGTRRAKMHKYISVHEIGGVSFDVVSASVIHGGIVCREVDRIK